MNLEHIKVFVAVYRTRNFTLVANTLNVAPSSVSRAVASLEDSLKTRLFQRTTRTLTPTQAGEHYFSRVASVIEELENVHKEISDDARGPTGCLRVTASVSYGQIVIAPNLHKFYQRYPNIEIEMVLSDSPIDIVSNQIDLAVRHGRMQNSSLIARRLSKVTYSMVASADYIKHAPTITSPDHICDHPLITFTYDGFQNEWELQKLSETRKISITPILSVTNAKAILECVKSGLGLGTLADWTIQHDIDSGALVRVLPDWQVAGHQSDSAIWLVYPSRTFIPAKTRAFERFLQDLSN